MTAAIPDDIRLAAQKAEQDCCDLPFAGRTECEEIIAQALQAERNRATEAERERCAAVAEELAESYKAVGHIYEENACIFAAEAIRNQPPAGK